MVNNELSHEEQRALAVKKTLEYRVLQDVIGSNLVQSSPYLYTGELGLQSAKSVYDGVMSGEDVQKRKEEIYNTQLKKGRDLGIIGEPTYTSNYDISVGFAEKLEEVLAIARLGELEEHAKKVGAKLDFEVPEELKGYSQAELIQKVYNTETKKVELDKLSQEEQDALRFYETFRESYKRACALNASQANYFADLNAQGHQIADNYKKEEKD